MYIDKSITGCFSGHRSFKSLDFHNTANDAIFEFERLCEKAIQEAIESGYDTFIFGGCEGFGIKIAGIVNFYKNKLYKHIKLICAVPFPQQADSWTANLQNRYRAILSDSDEIITLSDHYYKGVYHVRNRFMVDNSSLLIYYYNGSKGGTKFTFDYAVKKNLKIVNLFTEQEIE